MHMVLWNGILADLFIWRSSICTRTVSQAAPPLLHSACSGYLANGKSVVLSKIVTLDMICFVSFSGSSATRIWSKDCPASCKFDVEVGIHIKQWYRNGLSLKLRGIYEQNDHELHVNLSSNNLLLSTTQSLLHAITYSRNQMLILKVR